MFYRLREGGGGEVVVVVVGGGGCSWRYKTDPCPFIHEFEIRVYLNGYHWGGDGGGGGGGGMLLSAGSMIGIY